MNYERKLLSPTVILNEVKNPPVIENTMLMGFFAKAQNDEWTKVFVQTSIVDTLIN